jgi:hypothetical protein
MRIRTTFFSLVLLLLSAGCATEAWNTARSADTISAYEEFLRDYPKGELADRARDRLSGLREKQDWDTAMAGNTIPSYVEFLRKHPQGPLAAEARDKLSQLTEKGDWRAAIAEDSSEAYEEFLRQHPKGELADLARERAAWGAARASNTISSYQEFLRKYPRGTYSDRARGNMASVSEGEAIEAIRAHGPSNRFALPAIKPEGRLTQAFTVKALSESSVVLLREADSDQFVATFGKDMGAAAWNKLGDGSVVRFAGAVQWGGLTIASESGSDDRLAFGLFASHGLVCLHGSGSVILPSRTVVLKDCRAR